MRICPKEFILIHFTTSVLNGIMWLDQACRPYYSIKKRIWEEAIAVFDTRFNSQQPAIEHDQIRMIAEVNKNNLLLV